MGPFGSTSIGAPGERKGERKGELRRAAGWVLNRGPRPLPRDELVTLLFPMVSRAVRTDRGPAALVRWLRHRAAARPGQSAEHVARRLTEDLVRVLSESPGGRGDTVGGQSGSRSGGSQVVKS